MTGYMVGHDEISATSAADLVRQMHKMSATQEESDQAFMDQVASRTKIQNGKDVRTDTAANFVRDLIDMGLVRIKG